MNIECIHLKETGNIIILQAAISDKKNEIH